jgi:hypothetical protein
MVVRFGAGNEAAPLCNTASACLLLAHPGVDLEQIAQMADQAVKLGQDSFQMDAYLCVAALAQYRQGNFAAAAERAGKSSAQAVTTASRSPDWNTDVAACSVLAMAQHQLKHSDEANTALAKAADLGNSKLPRLETSALEDDWAGWLIAHMLLREAQALVQPTSEIKK